MNSSKITPAEKGADAPNTKPPRIFSLEETLAIANSAITYANEHIKIGSSQLINNQLSPEEFLSRRKAIGENGLGDNFGIRDLANSCLLEDSLDSNIMLAFFENLVSASYKYSIGNCNELAFLALDYILHYADPDMNGELFVIEDGDHTFLVLNRDPRSKDDSPVTWGENAVVCDPWAKIAYKASEILDKLNDFERVSGMNVAKPFNPYNQNLTCEKNYTTTYLRKHRSVSRIRENFIYKLKELIRIIFNYREKLFAESYINHNSDCKINRIFSTKIKQIDKFISSLHNQIDMVKMLHTSSSPAGEEHLDEYRLTKIKLNSLLKTLIIQARDTMQFSPADQQELFADKNKKLGIFSIFRKPPVQMQTSLHKNLEALSGEASKSLLNLRKN